MRNFLNLKDIPVRDLKKILIDAKRRKRLRKRLNNLEIDKGEPLKGKLLIQMFEKSSLRTRLSFYLAIKQLGGSTLTLRPDELHLSKGGESIQDTAKILSKNPIRCYPTTAAGSSSTSWSVYWDGTTKCSLKRMLPKDVILNGMFVENLPNDVVIDTTYDVVSHCLDSMSSINATKESVEYCKTALEILRTENNNFGLIKAGDIAGKAIEIVSITMLTYLTLSLAISLLMNWYNKKIAIKEK